jgi:uncharacterized protein
VEAGDVSRRDMDAFVGRERELAILDGRLEDVRRSGRGEFVAIRGRRRVGKSRLVEELARRSGCPCVFYTALGESGERERERFLEAVAESGAPASSLVRDGARAETWEAALKLAVGGLTREHPLILVIDELPYLVAVEPPIEATLQLFWDRVAHRAPVLLIVIGSDRATMESLSSEGRPLYDRPREMTIEPLTPADVSEMLALDPLDALDAYLVTGGFPVLALEWGAGRTFAMYLREALENPTSFLLVSGERTLAAEFPQRAQARAVLSAIGSDARVYRDIAARSQLPGTSLREALALLGEKRLVQRTTPYAAVAHPKNARYAIVDSYLRFWLRFVGADGIELAERGRGGVLFERTRVAWPAYRGAAIEPVVRTAIERLLPDERFGSAMHVGSFWTRDNSVELDLVGGDKTPVAAAIGFVGSIKWRASAPFDRADLGALTRQRASLPGADDATLLVGVSRSGFARGLALDVALSAEDILAAYRFGGS